jgi:hemin uptake protein HemP
MQATLTSSTAQSANDGLRLDGLTSDRRDALAAHPGAAGAVQSADLLQGKKAVEINHNGAIYRLQSTKLGKLILTK